MSLGNNRYNITAFFMVICLATVTANLSAADLRVRVIGVEASRGGTIDAGLYASEEGYLEAGYEVAGMQMQITGDIVEGVFTDLPAGSYVVAVIHDENGNHDMDTRGALGMPTEGYGFSGSDRPKLMPPKFRAAAIPLDANGSATAEVHLKYN